MIRVGAIILAAGRSSRMGRNKMLEPIGGKAMLLHVTEAVLGASLAGPIIALGHEVERIRPILQTYQYIPVYVERFEEGMSHSLRAALVAVPDDWAAAFICLGDMPFITAPLLDGMNELASPEGIVVPVFGGRRGNPVLWGRRFFAEMMESEGDTGAKALLTRHAQSVTVYPAPDAAIHRDIDRTVDLPKSV